MSKKAKRKASEIKPGDPEIAATSQALFPIRTTALAAACICILGGIAFWNSFNGAFVFDDDYHIVENDNLHCFWPPWNWLNEGRGISRPVVTFTLAANYGLGRLRPWGYHFVNLSVHLLASLTLFGVIRRTLITPRLRETFGAAATPLALVATLLWMVHPLQTQSVTYVVQRCESMMGLFLALALYCSIRGYPSSRAWLWYSGASLAALLGAGCKQVIIVVPILAFVYDAVFLSETFQGAARRWKAHAVLCSSWIGVAVITALMPAASSAGFSFPMCSPVEYARSQPGVILHYLQLALWPDHLCLDYWWPIATTATQIVPQAFVLLLLLGATVYALRRAPAWGFLGAWFFLILAPTSSILPIADLAVEHRMYLSLASVSLAVVCGAFLLGRKLIERSLLAPGTARMCAAALALILLSALTARTILRNCDYYDASRMWKQIVEFHPHNARAQSNLGASLTREGRFDEAIKQYGIALKLAPDAAEVYNNLGSAYSRQGMTDESIVYYRKAVELDPKYVAAHCNLGAGLATKGLHAEAVEHYKKALELNPSYAEAYSNMSSALVEMQKYDEAIDCLKKALSIDPNLLEALNNMGTALCKKGLLDEGAAAYRRAIQVSPTCAEARTNLANTLVKMGRTEEAAQEYREAMRLAPEYPEPRNNLGNTLMNVGRIDEAIVLYGDAIKAKPSFAPAHNNLATALERKGQLEESIKEYLKAVEINPDYAEAHNNLGGVFAQLNRPADAAKHFREAVRANPSYVDAQSNIGNALAQMQKYDDAIVEFKKALVMRPDYAEVHGNLGMAYALKGMRAEAIVEFKEALRLKPDFEKARQNLEKLTRQ